MQFEFYVPSRIIFGEGSLEELGKRTLPGKKAMLVTSRGGSAKRSGALDKVLSALKACGEKMKEILNDLDKLNAFHPYCSLHNNHLSARPTNGWHNRSGFHPKS